MSQSAKRFGGKKPEFPACREIREHFEAMDAEQAEFVAMLEHLYDYSYMDDAYENSILKLFQPDDPFEDLTGGLFARELEREHEMDRAEKDMRLIYPDELW